MIPGFVDSHTHPVFDGDRANEFSMKLAGASYMEIHAAGGGIHSTVKGSSSLNLTQTLNFHNFISMIFNLNI